MILLYTVEQSIDLIEAEHFLHTVTKIAHICKVSISFASKLKWRYR